ncbi:flagellar hook protein FlgE [Massilia sp. IC2-477]|uniref:flagellar hook protein FlgE n=1 Tax=unclassified Massilia TaxID=2609279 RepID=UPI001D10B5E4|nr:MULTISPECIES: flagellar hook protein FlgE [unclassified Massilia]MCC2957022.1 flagellar hook protein FlgE [Massilia sp. IC2-477]MCC2970831.1 flagellar hook protein FlgE [Massilia sp. IC2-476]
MSFQQGLSGLNGAAKSLDVIGNNIANSSTVGFKGSTTQFADVYASSLNGAGGISAGIGVKVANIAQQFTQGNVEASNNPLDIAINGAGFFRTEASGIVQYSRNGQFSLDKNGFLINAQGAKLTGYGLNQNGQLVAGTPTPLQIDTSDLAPVTTTAAKIELNLDSRSLNPTNSPFNADDPTTYNKQVPMSVYDTLGNAHTMSTYYVKTGPGTWDVYAANDGTEVTNLEVASAATGTGPTFTAVNNARAAWEAATKAVPPVPATIAAALNTYATAAAAMVSAAAGGAGATTTHQTEITTAATNAAAVPGATPDEIDAAMTKTVKVKALPVGKLVFDTNGGLNKALTEDAAGTAGGKFAISLPVFPSTGSENTMPITIDFDGTTQYGTKMSEKKLSQDGYAAGTLQRFSTGTDGTILGQYSNGQTKPLGQVILANFTNPNGLEPLGNNAFAESSNSGVPLLGTPNSGSFGVLQQSAVEASNVDLTAELVNMITAQRVYQANAQTIKTQDSVLQTLVNLR